MVITQKRLYEEIAEMEVLDIETVRRVFKSAGRIVFDFLSSTTPSEERKVKLMDGLSIESRFIPSHYIDQGIFRTYLCNGRIKVKAKLTKYYRQKVNEHFENKSD